MAIQRNSRQSLLLASTATVLSTGIAFTFLAIVTMLFAFLWAGAEFTGQTDGWTSVTPILMLGAAALPAALIMTGVMSVGVSLLTVRVAVSAGQRRLPSLVLGSCAILAYPLCALIALALDKSVATIASIPALILLLTSPWWAPLSAASKLSRRTTEVLIAVGLASASIALLIQLT